MTDKEKIIRIRKLLESASRISSPYLTKCSETKILAYTNREEAQTLYRSIVKEALDTTRDVVNPEHPCNEKISEAVSVLRKGAMSADILTALNLLRESYLKEILKPAVNGFLTNAISDDKQMESLFEKMMTLNGLIDLGEFFDRMSSL